MGIFARIRGFRRMTTFSNKVPTPGLGMTVVEALVNYDSKEHANRAQYTWDPDAKVWWKLIAVSDVINEARAVPFAIKDRKTGEILHI